MIIGTGDNGHAVKIDVPRLVETRMLVQANSGAGKSWTLRRILEQTHGKIQQIVIDVEDEFYTLREKYDYVLAGRHGGDCPADVRSASLLARRLLELGVSSIIGIYELKHRERIQFVKLFLESLLSAPRELWHPCLIVLDEAHGFAPEKGEGEAESAEAVVDLMSKGRKRAFCGILATQRISKLHKSAAAEANNKLIGRSALDTDMKRAARELGFSNREDELSLRTLGDGEFYAFGPAISNIVTKVHVGSVETTHPKAGQRAAPPPPPKEKVQKVLAQLADLPKEVEQENQDRTALQRRVLELENGLRQAKNQAPPADPETIRKACEKAASLARQDVLRTWQPLAKAAESVIQAANRLQSAIPTATEARSISSTPVVFHARPIPSAPAAENTGDLTGPEQRIVDAIAWLESLGIQAPEQVAVAFLAGYTFGGGAFNNPRGSLRKPGSVRARDILFLG